MFAERDVLSVLRVTNLVLAFDPDDEEAAELLSEAHRKGEIYARSIVHNYESSPPVQQKRTSQKQKLRKAMLLSPHGEYGQRARELLGEDRKKSS